MNLSTKERVYVSATAGFKWSFTDYLAFESNNNVNFFLERADTYTDPNTIGGQATQGSVYNWYQMRQDFFTNQMLRFNKSIDKHNITALAAYEFSRVRDMNMYATGKGTAPGLDAIGATTGVSGLIEGDLPTYNIQSLLMNANYAYDNRYLFQASYRLDGSSKFGKDNQYGSFYTFSGGWNISNEKFWEPIKDVVDALKLRASWGVVGNMPNGGYNHVSTYEVGQYNGNPALFPKAYGNNSITWEKNQTTNIGLDVSFINRIRLSVDAYAKETTDLLYEVRLPSITGYETQWQNIGAISNKGIEFSVNADIISNEDWLWNVDFNIGFNKNKIISLYGGKAEIKGIRRLEEGRDMDDLYLAEWAGVNPDDGSPLWYTGKPGEERKLTGSYNSATGDNRAYIGSAAPKYTGGFGTMLSWKNLTLNANFAFSVGGKMYSQLREVVDSDGAYVDYNSMVLHDGWSRWEKAGDVATHPKAINGGNNMSNKVSSRYVEDGSFLTMRNLSLTYNLPESVTKKLKLKGLGLSFSADNVFTLTNYSLISPDAAAYSADGYAGWGAYPTTRSFIFGVNVRF